jgi:hypothetical protein
MLQPEGLRFSRILVGFTAVGDSAQNGDMCGKVFQTQGCNGARQRDTNPSVSRNTLSVENWNDTQTTYVDHTKKDQHLLIEAIPLFGNNTVLFIAF